MCFPLWLLLGFFFIFFIGFEWIYFFLYVSYIGILFDPGFIVLLKFATFCHYFFKDSVVFSLSSSLWALIACRLMTQLFFHLQDFFLFLFILSLYCQALKLINFMLCITNLPFPPMHIHVCNHNIHLNSCEYNHFYFSQVSLDWICYRMLLKKIVSHILSLFWKCWRMNSSYC